MVQDTADWQMEKAGYKNPSVQEKELWHVVGEKAFYRLIDYAFRDAYWTCKYLEIMPGDSNFPQVFQRVRRQVVQDALDMAYRGDGEYIDFIVKTDVEIVRAINSECYEEKEPLLLEERCG